MFFLFFCVAANGERRKKMAKFLSYEDHYSGSNRGEKLKNRHRPPVDNKEIIAQKGKKKREPQYAINRAFNYYRYPFNNYK